MYCDIFPSQELVIKLLSDIRSDCSCWFIEMKRSRVFKSVSITPWSKTRRKCFSVCRCTFNYSSICRQFFFFFFLLQVLWMSLVTFMGMCIVLVGTRASREVLDEKEPRWHVYFVKAISINIADSLMIQCTHQRGERLLICCRLMFMWYFTIIYSAGLLVGECQPCVNCSVQCCFSCNLRFTPDDFWHGAMLIIFRKSLAISPPDLCLQI